MRFTRRHFLWTLGALSAGAYAQNTVSATPDAEQFTVAALNDIHLLDAASGELLKRAVERINTIPELRFSLILGDLSTSGKREELALAKQYLEGFKKPYFVVPGNHDVDPKASDPYAAFVELFGKTQWTHREGKWLFVGLDSCVGTASDVSVPAERIEWLKAQLPKEAPAAPIALCCHHPLNPHTKYRIKNADEILGLFKEFNLKVVMSGHWHGNQVEEQDGVLFVTTACCSTTRDNFDKTTAKGFRFFHMKGVTVTTEFVEI